MKTLTRRLLQAYRPLYLHGLRMDGHYRLPPAAAEPTPSPARNRMLLVALCGLARIHSSARNPT